MEKVRDKQNNFGNLNFVGEETFRTGRPWVIIDFGVSESFGIDDIVSVQKAA